MQRIATCFEMVKGIVRAVFLSLCSPGLHQDRLADCRRLMQIQQHRFDCGAVTRTLKNTSFSSQLAFLSTATRTIQ